MTFEPITLVPMQLKMVVPSLLTEKEVINIRFLIKQNYTFTFANMFPYMNLSKRDNVYFCVNFLMTSQWLQIVFKFNGSIIVKIITLCL